MSYENQKWIIVKFDETENFKKEFLENSKLNKIYGIYIVNLNIVTHYCEITPSYTLSFVEYQWEYLPEVDVSLEDDFIFDVENEMLKEENNAVEHSLILHCSYLDKYLEQNPEMVKNINNWIEQEEYEDALETENWEIMLEELLIEKYHCNPIF